MFHFFCLSWKATNGLLLNVVRLCLNLTEHMLGGIKAILFLKQCSTQLSLSIISSQLLLQNEISCCSTNAAVCFEDGSEIDVLIESYNPLTYRRLTWTAPTARRQTWIPVGEDLGAMFFTLGETVV